MANELKPIDVVCQSIQGMRDKFASCLPPQIPADKFTRVALTAIQNSPTLLECTKASIYSELLKCAADGLVPDGREAAIVKFKGVAKYMPMVSGILKKVRNSGELSAITSQVVHEKDEFNYHIDDDGEHLTHKPLVFGERGKALGVYALAKLKDGSVMIEFMTAAQVEAVKKISRAQDGPWSGPFEHEMWRKTVIRRLSKRLPMSTDLEEFMHRDDDLYDLNGDDAPKKPASDRPTRLSGMLNKGQKQSDKPAEEPVDAEYETVPPDDAPDANEGQEAAAADEKPAETTAYIDESILPQGYKVVEGTVEDLKVKTGSNAKGPWKRFSCKVKGEYYGTFSEDFGKTITECCDAQNAIRIYYTAREEGGKIYRDICAIQELTAAKPAAGAEEVPI